MEIPLEIKFHDVPASDEIEAVIREHVARLEKLYPRMIGCRVAVEMRHKQHRTGNVPEVHIEIRVPQREIVVSREPHHAKQRRAAPNTHTTIRDAFKAAEKRLKEFKRQQNGEIKVKEAPLRGYVSQLIAEKKSSDPFFYHSSQSTSPPRFRCRASRSLITPRLVLMMEIPRPFRIGRSLVAGL